MSCDNLYRRNTGLYIASRVLPVIVICSCRRVNRGFYLTMLYSFAAEVGRLLQLHADSYRIQISYFYTTKVAIRNSSHDFMHLTTLACCASNPGVTFTER